MMLSPVHIHVAQTPHSPTGSGCSYIVFSLVLRPAVAGMMPAFRTQTIIDTVSDRSARGREIYLWDLSKVGTTLVMMRPR